MKPLIAFLFAIALTFAAASLAPQLSNQDNASIDKQIIEVCEAPALAEKSGAQNDVEKSGCCSWHGGVCGCD